MHAPYRIDNPQLRRFTPVGELRIIGAPVVEQHRPYFQTMFASMRANREEVRNEQRRRESLERASTEIRAERQRL